MGHRRADGSQDRCRRSHEATVFMRALVRFATAEVSTAGDRAAAFLASFQDVYIGPETLRYEFRRSGLGPPLPGEPDLRLTTPAALRSLQRDLRRDLIEMADSTGVWRQFLPLPRGVTNKRDRFIVKMRLKRSGREVSFDVTDAVVVLPDSLRRRIQSFLPRHELTGVGSIEPTLGTASLRQLLYFGLTVALSERVLLRCRKCSNCGTLVVHHQRPLTMRVLWFCSGVDRDCKTAYHNARRSKPARSAAQRSWRTRQRARVDALEREAATVGALKRFLDAVDSKPDDPNVTRTVRRMGSGAVHGWKLVRGVLVEVRKGRCMSVAWDALSDAQRAVVAENWPVSQASSAVLLGRAEPDSANADRLSGVSEVRGGKPRTSPISWCADYPGSKPSSPKLTYRPSPRIT